MTGEEPSIAGDSQYKETMLCGECGEEFVDCHVRDGRGPVVSEVEIFTCPNGHSGRKNYDYDGFLTQSMGIQYGEDNAE